MSKSVLPYFVVGEVIKGFGRGSKQLGIPTANFPPSVVKDLPEDLNTGVYFGFASIDKGDVYKMVMSVGWNPYFKNKQKSMETHLMHTFDEDFYGKELRVCILEYIRCEKDFTSVEDLVKAIKCDIDTANVKLDTDKYIHSSISSGLCTKYFVFLYVKKKLISRMALSAASRVSLQLLKELPTGFLKPCIASSNLELVRYRRTKHYDPKFKFLRSLKFIKVKLPDYNETNDNLTEEQMRAKLKERGLLPKRPWMEHQYFISSTGAVFEPYVPPEGDGKISPITAQGAKQKIQFLEKKTKTMMAIRKIRSFEEDFDTTQFCKKAENIYIKAHECMALKDKDEIIKYVTERAYPEVIHNMENKTISWKFLKSIELPRVVHARCTDIVTKENMFGQVTVRFHTQQVLAVYDRFGRLLQGSEIIAKDVLEYVVFEKHIANEYGIWRIHDKIIPDWLPPREPSHITFKKFPEPAEAEVDNQDEQVASKKKSTSEVVAT
ncbi:hypothetical protein RN001_001357 [Aquatica leii]|uniref:Large ribosomal subunit protein mL45 n=1 Tax=Aquatica leii TaxID=1421715 RepID=A0AAN7PL49_9COLE|nr:hypothetical protein RN001_001357 [Aquatica leii]